MRFVNSLGLGEPPTYDPIARRLAADPGLRFKLDVTSRVAAGADRRGGGDRRGRDRGLQGPLRAGDGRAERDAGRCTNARWPCSPTRCSRTRTRCRRSRRCSAGEATGSPTTRRSTRSPTSKPSAPPRALNIKPCRVGDLQALFALYEACTARGLIVRRRDGRARRRPRPDPAAGLPLPRRRPERHRAVGLQRGHARGVRCRRAPCRRTRRRWASGAPEPAQWRAPRGGASRGRRRGRGSRGSRARGRGRRSATGSSSIAWQRWPNLASGPASLVPISCQQVVVGVVGHEQDRLGAARRPRRSGSPGCRASQCRIHQARRRAPSPVGDDQMNRRAPCSRAAPRSGGARPPARTRRGRRRGVHASAVPR